MIVKRLVLPSSLILDAVGAVDVDRPPNVEELHTMGFLFCSLHQFLSLT